MVSTASILMCYSVVSSIIIVVLSALYHACGGQAPIKNNSGEIDQRIVYDIGLVNESVNNESGSTEQCHCWGGVELTILETIVMGVLCLVGLGLTVKFAFHAKVWIMKNRLQTEQKKLMKVEKMRKMIMEEHKNTPAQEGIQEEP